MKKYFIFKTTAEIEYKNRFDIKPGCTENDLSNYEEIAIFNSKEEAIEEMKKYKSSICRFSSPIGLIYKVEEYDVQEIEMDEDEDECGEWGDVLERTEFQIAVDDAHYDTVATFGNFRDAEEFINESDEELRLMV